MSASRWYGNRETLSHVANASGSSSHDRRTSSGIAGAAGATTLVAAPWRRARRVARSGSGDTPPEAMRARRSRTSRSARDMDADALHTPHRSPQLVQLLADGASLEGLQEDVRRRGNGLHLARGCPAARHAPDVRLDDRCDLLRGVEGRPEAGQVADPPRGAASAGRGIGASVRDLGVVEVTEGRADAGMGAARETTGRCRGALYHGSTELMHPGVLQDCSRDVE